MKVFVIGSGGREHVIIWSLLKSKRIKEIFCAPGNGGISQIAKCVPIAVKDFDKLAEFALENNIDFTVVGMDEPLVNGIVDVFEKQGLKIFGPRKNAAILEGSKAFSKQLMKKYNIPTAKYEAFDNYDKAVEYINIHKMPVVVKADGLALGKGVIICESIADAEAALKEIMLDKKFGSSGNTVVIEEFLTGRELSLLCFCDGKTIAPMASAQDYKRAYDDDKGLNTGGMGTISPSPVINDEILQSIIDDICYPTANAMLEEGREFKGVIYFGLMLTDDGVKVIEYNVRFGDPEAQVVLPKLRTDLIDVLEAVENGTLDKINIEWEQSAACCVILASGGYPEAYEKGHEIKGISEAEKTAFVFHAGTSLEGERLITSGGRVMGVTALGKDLKEARDTAYNAAEKIGFTNKQFRTDIGAK